MSRRIFGLSFFSRASNCDLILASYHPRRSKTWIWYLCLIRNPFCGSWRDPARQNQWHDYYALPFGYALRIGRQDYHKQTRGEA